MATCQEEIELAIAELGPEETYTRILTNVVYPMPSTRLAKGKLMLDTSKQETATCYFSQYGTPADINISWFKLNPDGATVKLVGSIRTKEGTLTFLRDLLPGTYYICFSPLIGDSNADFKAVFTGYTSAARFRAIGYSGSAMYLTGDELKLGDKPKRSCREPMLFEMVSGELPPGLILNPDGSIRGYLPNIDCVKSTTSPSAVWYYENHDNMMVPLPGKWTFTAKVSLYNFPHVFDIETFYIEVYHDWNKELKYFDDVDEYQKIVAVAVEKKKPVLESLCPPPIPKPEFRITRTTPDQTVMSSEIAKFLERMRKVDEITVEVNPFAPTNLVDPSHNDVKYNTIAERLNSENPELWYAQGVDGSEMFSGELITTAKGLLWEQVTPPAVFPDKTEVLMVYEQDVSGDAAAQEEAWNYIEMPIPLEARAIDTLTVDELQELEFRKLMKEATPVIRVPHREVYTPPSGMMSPLQEELHFADPQDRAAIQQKFLASRLDIKVLR